jgi:hypothetical protein
LEYVFHTHVVTTHKHKRKKQETRVKNGINAQLQTHIACFEFGSFNNKYIRGL